MTQKNKRLKSYNMAKVGRPTKLTTETINKLEEVFSLGGTDEEACFYADIGMTTLYEYQEKHPEFTDRKKALKNSPILKARRTVVNGLEQDPEFSLKYLTKKKRDEFGDNLDLTSGGEKIDSIKVKIIDPNGTRD